MNLSPIKSGRFNHQSTIELESKPWNQGVLESKINFFTILESSLSLKPQATQWNQRREMESRIEVDYYSV